MTLARTDTFDQRARILGRLTVRNRVVAVLRIAVPAAGVVAFVLLVGQIYIANMLNHYGVSGIRVDRGNLVVETPQYSGIGADGSRYVVNAREARAPLASPDAIDMIDATLDVTRPHKAAFRASGETASMNTTSQVVTVPGLTRIRSDDGLHGTMIDVHADLMSGITIARGPIDVTFADGTTLTAANMHYDGNKALWNFDHATLVVPELPEGQVPPVPFATSAWVTR